MAISEKYRNKRQARTQSGEAANAERRAHRPNLCVIADEPWPKQSESSEDIVAALRGFFLTHTLDPLTGEVHTIH